MQKYDKTSHFTLYTFYDIIFSYYLTTELIMDKIIVNSHAKINLCLDVTAKRADGYHEIEMIMAQCGLCDSITIEKLPSGITLKTNLPFLPVDERNIAYKAAQSFFSACGIAGGAAIDVAKRIPVGAGLAGGSGNGAAVLIGLNKLYGANLTADQLCALALPLGADVPYCVLGGTMLARGIGEALTPLPPLPRTAVVLVKPPFSVSTPSVYKKIDNTEIKKRPDAALLTRALAQRDISLLAANMVNVMEEVTASMHPVIKRIKQDLLNAGALGALMSGSGPSVFALFDSYEQAKKAAVPFRKRFFTYVGWTR